MLRGMYAQEPEFEALDSCNLKLQLRIDSQHGNGWRKPKGIYIGHQMKRLNRNRNVVGNSSEAYEDLHSGLWFVIYS
jgi:hypothetical protein